MNTVYKFFSCLMISFLIISSNSGMELSPQEKAQIIAKEKENFRSMVMPIVQRAKELVAKKDMVRPIIAIAGCSAVGKSKFTRRLAAILNDEKIRVSIFGTDDFLQPTPVTKPPMHSFAHRNFDPYRLHEVMQQLVAGKNYIQKPVWDHHTWSYSTKKEIVECFENTDLILLEGTYALSDSSTYDLLKYSDCRIFIEAPEEVIVSWNWQRELKDSNPPRSRKEFDADIAWDMEDYQKIILPSKKYADFVIVKDQNHQYQLATATP